MKTYNNSRASVMVRWFILASLTIGSVALAVDDPLWPEKDFWLLACGRPPPGTGPYRTASIRFADGSIAYVQPGDSIPGSGWTLVDIRKGDAFAADQRHRLPYILICKDDGGSTFALHYRPRWLGQPLDRGGRVRK